MITKTSIYLVVGVTITVDTDWPSVAQSALAIIGRSVVYKELSTVRARRQLSAIHCGAARPSSGLANAIPRPVRAKAKEAFMTINRSKMQESDRNEEI
jgi:hypothetical protein